MSKLDSVDLETIEMLKQSYNENNTNEKKEEEPKNKTNPNITTEHLIEMARNGLTLYYQKNHPNFPMYGYLIEMFCLSCYGLVEKYELHKSATIKPEVGIVLSGTILALPIIKDIKDGKQKPKENPTQKPSGDPLKNKKETKNDNEVEVVETKSNPNNIELNKNNAMPKNSIAGDIYND
tara:strand:- start:398 stop:934 length:537 start_codon:yes stop_codon:yes gene_type:complete